jgi:RecJ-like exonuclease
MVNGSTPGRPLQDEIAPGDDAPAGMPGTGEAVCPECAGTGRLRDRICPNCEGRGKVVQGIGGG